MTKAGEQPTITQSDFEIVVGIRRKKTNVSTSELLRLINGGAVISSIRQLPRTSLAAQDGLVEALEKVRKCALVVPSIFPDTPPSVSWIVSELTKILPEMDAALSAIKGDKS
jgi:hypothetical protein